MSKANSKTSETLIFLHIVKTAGTTLHRIIERQVPPREDYFLREPDHLFDDFIGLTKAEKARLRMLRGHMVFGMHEHLPQPATYFTLLRDPLERTISYFHHIRRSPDHHAHEAIVSRGLNLQQAIENEVDNLLINGQTRVLAGGPWHDHCTPDAFQAARRNLDEHFAVVGLVERFDESLWLMKKTFGWRNLFYTRRNVGKRRPRQDDLPPQVLAAVREANQIDQKLYDYAAGRLDAQVHRQGPLFAAQVKLFQWANPWMGKLASLSSRT